MAFWVYSDKSEKTEYWLEDSPIQFDKRQLYTGWNFFGVTPDMYDKTLQEIKGDCNILNSAWWSSMQQSWQINLSEKRFNNQILGQGIIINVESNCKLGTGGSSVNPPQIPN